MRKLIFLMALTLLMASCKTLEVQDLFYPEEPYMNVVKTAGFSVRIAGDDPDCTSGCESVFQKKAAEKCFELTARDILLLQPLLKGSYAPVSIPDDELIRFEGEISPSTAPLTGDMVQDFQCSTAIYPHFELAGEIAGLEEERTIVARSARVFLALFRDTPPGIPAYFVIGRRTKEQDVNLISIFGSGRIIQIVDEKILKGEDSDAKIIIAQGIVMETTREVAKDDLIFLAEMNIRAVEKPKEDAAFPPAPASTEDEIRVIPEVREPEPVPMEKPEIREPEPVPWEMK